MNQIQKWTERFPHNKITHDLAQLLENQEKWIEQAKENGCDEDVSWTLPLVIKVFGDNAISYTAVSKPFFVQENKEMHVTCLKIGCVGKLANIKLEFEQTAKNLIAQFKYFGPIVVFTPIIVERIIDDRVGFKTRIKYEYENIRKQTASKL